MKLKIVASTDGKFQGLIFKDAFPIRLGDQFFTPDHPPIKIDQRAWRFYNSNYSIDAIEVK